MIIDDQHYDVIIVGSGAGGGTLAQKLAPTGKRILILERGAVMALEEQNRANIDVFKKGRYRAPEQWYDQEGEPFSPQTNYAVGGNTKIYNATLMRMRDRDFEAVTYQDGVTPEWPVKYADWEPYYTAAEQLYQVHGDDQSDPTEPAHSAGYPHPAVDHTPVIQPFVDLIKERGLHPTSLPMSLTKRDDDPTGDAEVFGIDLALKHDNVTLKTNARVVGLHTNPTGTEIAGVQVEDNEKTFLFKADIVVLACGAVNSAALMLDSANEQHPNGLANSSDQLGRNLMKHLMTVIVERGAADNDGTFLPSVSVNDFYWGDEYFNYPMGHIENSGGLLQDIVFAESPPLLSVLAQFLPGAGLQQLVKRSIGWWAQTGTLPKPNNRVYWQESTRFDGLRRRKLRYEFTPNNLEAHDRLVYRWMGVLKDMENTGMGLRQSTVYPRGESPTQVVGYQCGTARMGTDPATSVLDVNCRTHEIDNLYVVDSSFFPSCASVSPALTVMANALRVGDHLIDRLKG
ncbi:MAG: dehydrogenase [Leptolyngbya foveolarum]|uniref:Dehydrogenase n=1 Tax=Leptolyngbya foveolarum TaxID=47253 RepID=A0A2W4WS09_9CYAN|nr:MAG: dehydrogenase [Leptolyngbya foveolarum]